MDSIVKIDEKAKKLAELVVNYSVEIVKGDNLLIQYRPEYFEYACLIGNLARQKGANVEFDNLSYCFYPYRRKLIEKPDEKGWERERDRKVGLAKWCTARILLDCDIDEDYTKGIPDAEEICTKFDKEVTMPFSDIIYRAGKNSMYAVKWNIVAFPAKDLFRESGMGLDEYLNLVYNTTIGVDWNKETEQMKKVKNLFDYTENVRIVVPGLTDIQFSLKTRGGGIFDGKYNQPDGEVAYSPVEDSANGFIYFQYPTKTDTGTVKGIKLEFKDGVVINYSAEENQSTLENQLKIDDGAKRIGEFGIGFNTGIQNPVGNILYDEKIAGIIHLALGESVAIGSLDEGGGLNEAGIHWDLLCDLRRKEDKPEKFPGGIIYVNGKLVNKNGGWIF